MVRSRKARPAEYARAGEIVLAAYESLPGEHMSHGYAEELADVSARAATTEILVAVDDRDDLLGCVTFVPDASSPWAEMLGDNECGIRMLGVDPAAQGRGAGWVLVQACLDRARELGRSAVSLHSTPWMTAAHSLYERAGFVRTPDRDWLPVPEVPLIAYRFDLAPGASEAELP